MAGAQPRLIVFAAVAAAAAIVAGAASADREKVQIVPADQGAAKAAVLKAADLGAGWHGGAKKPDDSPAPTCAGYHPKQSDLVVTGQAETEFTRVAVDVDDEVQLLKTDDMVRTDWRRSVTPTALPCLRQTLAKETGKGSTVVSLNRVAFPRLTSMTAAYRAVLDVIANRQKVRVDVDVVLVGTGRSEITLTLAAPAAAAAGMRAAETRLAHLLVSRTARRKA